MAVIAPAYSAANQQGNARRHATITTDPGLDIGDIDGTPMTVALIGGTALLVLVFLKRLGFRFDYGISTSGRVGK